MYPLFFLHSKQTADYNIPNRNNVPKNNRLYYNSLILMATPPLGAKRCLNTVLQVTFRVEIT